MADGHRSLQATGTAFTGPVTLTGVQAASVAGGTVTVYNNTSAAGVIVYEKELAANESSFDALPGVECSIGLHVVVTGTIDVVLTVD